ncbi:hypothetical protein SDC9_109846 [bioreactor metagenome]|uniref:Uncharacterized protein n=1 Tax=bioreactor metagenome TaxID=1076179 RepID=A0A645BD37_9ZZZZ
MTSYMPNKAPSGSISISINKGLLTNPNFNLDSNGDIYRIKMGEVIGEIDETVLLEKLVKISDASIIDKFKLKESEIMKINNSLIFQMALEK